MIYTDVYWKQVFVCENKNGVPNDPRNFVETSGIRIGTAAETTKGHKEDFFIKLASNICKLLG